MILNGCKGGSYQLTTTTTLCFTSLTTTTTVCKENILDGRRDEQLCSLRLLNTSRPVPTHRAIWSSNYNLLIFGIEYLHVEGFSIFPERFSFV